MEATTVTDTVTGFVSVSGCRLDSVFSVSVSVRAVSVSEQCQCQCQLCDPNMLTVTGGVQNTPAAESP